MINLVFRRLLCLAASIRSWMMLAALLSCLTVASGVGLLATSAYLISEAALHPSIAVLQVAIVGVRFFGISRGIFRYLERLTSHKATFRLLSRMRVWFYTALEPLVPARLMRLQADGGMRELRSGDLLRRAVADIDTLQNFYLRILAPPIVAVVIGLAMWMFLGAFGAVFALAYAGFFLLSSVGVPLLSHLLGRRIGQEITDVRAELHSLLVDSVQGLADLVAFGQEERQVNLVQQFNRRLNSLQITMAWISGIQGSLTNFFMNTMVWILLLLAIPLVATGQLNGVFVAVIVLTALASFEVVLPLPGAFQQIGGNIQAAQRLFEIVDASPAVHDPVQSAPRPTDMSIAVQHLNYRYGEEEPYVLHDIQFALSQGQCVALVGPSGSGKSTLAHILLRYWDYTEGTILLGERNLCGYRRDDLYALVGVVEQDTHLFNTTIRENLMLARSTATPEEMIDAAKNAQLHDFVMSLPDGYDTRVGEQGLRLSGGERQRIAIARAFLKDSPLLLLDEPTVNLDAITERAVLQAIRRLVQGRTTLLVTHRLVEMDMADEILVLTEGRIAERGRHLELLRNEGFYWRMWRQQQHLALKSFEH